MFHNLTRTVVFHSPLSLMIFFSLVVPGFGQEANSSEPTYLQTIPDPSALSEVQRVAQIEAQLKASKARLDVQDVPLGEVAKLLSAQLGIPIRLDLRVLNDVGLSPETPVYFQLPEVSAETLMRLLLKQYDLAYVIEAEGIVFTTPEETEDNVQARFYNIEEIIPGPNRDYDSLIYLISTIIEPESWDEGSGPSSMMPYQNGIILRQMQWVHQKIEGLMAALREAKNLPAEGYQTKALIATPSRHASAAIHDQLLRTKVTLEADQQPLQEIARLFEKQTTVPFLVDRRALEDIGESPEIPVDLTLHNVSVHHALNVLAEQLELAWFTLGEVVVITTSEEAESELEVRVYPVRDLTWNGWNPANREVHDLIEATEKYHPQHFGGGFGSAGWDHNLRVWDIPELPSRTEDLIETFHCNVEPDSWNNLGGSGGITYFQAADCLVVSQTHEVHQQIAALLQTIRNHQKPLDRNELADKIRQAEATTLVMFYSVPRDRQGDPKFTRDELNAIAGRIQMLYGKGTWNHDSHFIDVTQSVLIVRQRRDIQRQIKRFWSHLGSDESNRPPWQNNSGTWNQPQGGFGGGGFNNNGNQPATPLPVQSSSTNPTEENGPPVQQSGGVF